MLASLKNIIANDAKNKHIYDFQVMEQLITQFMARNMDIHEVKVGLGSTLMLRYNTTFNKGFYERLLARVEYDHTTLTSYINRAIYYELISSK